MHALPRHAAAALMLALTTGCTFNVAGMAPVPAAAGTAPAAAPAVALQGMSDEAYLALTDAQFAALSEAQLAAFTPGQVTGISQARLAMLSPGQAAALVIGHFWLLSDAQVAKLSPQLVAALTVSQLADLKPTHAKALTAAQLAALNADQAAAVKAAAAVDEEATPDRTPIMVSYAPPAPGGRTAAPTPVSVSTGLYITIQDGAISLLNLGGQGFQAGQFGYVPSPKQPPVVVVPAHPGVQFAPPPAFNATGPTATGADKANAVDCVVRYEVRQLPTQVGLTPPAAPAAAKTDDKKETSGTEAEKAPEKPAAKAYCN